VELLAETPAAGVTVAQIKAREGGELGFLAQLRDSLKSGGYRPAEVRQVMIPKGKSGKFRKLGIPTEPANCAVAQAG
jgi:RNA-directed DNA polymerase